MGTSPTEKQNKVQCAKEKEQCAKEKVAVCKRKELEQAKERNKKKMKETGDENLNHV